MISVKVIIGLALLVLTVAITFTFIVWRMTSDEKENTAKPCEEWKSIDLSDGFTDEDGSIISNGATYYKDEINTEGSIKRGCICFRNPCVRKCCPLDQMYTLYEENGEFDVTCTKANDTNLNSVLKYYDYITHYGPKEITTSNVSTVIVNHEIQPYCPDKKMTTPKNVYLLKNGSLLIYREANNEYRLKTIDEYCVDILNHTVKMTTGLHYFTCLKEDNSLPPIIELKLSIFSTCMLLSLPFLIATFLVYYFIPDLHNLVGKSLSSLTFSKIISYAGLTFAQLEGHHVGPLLCSPLGYLIQYSLLASFFWLNVMCFDIWLVFRVNRPQRTITKDVEAKKFLKYAIYAWGMPAIVCIIIYIADQILPENSSIKPMVGVNYCLINTDNDSRLVFYFFPLTVLLILNVVMFVTTACKIYQHKQQMAELKSKGNGIANQKNKERLNLYFKLFLIMGLTWIAEPMSSVFNEQPEWLWIVLDAINLLLGIMIFVIFVCKRRTIRTITVKLCASKKLFNNFRSTNSCKTESTLTTSSNSYKKSDQGESNKKEMVEMKKINENPSASRLPDSSSTANTSADEIILHLEPPDKMKTMQEETKY